MAPDALAVLERYHWPGNIRELENVLERAIVLGPSEMLERDALPSPLRQPPGPPGRRALEFREEGLDLEATLDGSSGATCRWRSTGRVGSRPRPPSCCE